MTNDRYTTIRIETDTLRKLRTLAARHERSAAGELRWLVRLEYDKWKKATALDKIYPVETKNER